MGLYNNVPTFTYVSASGITVTYNEKIYTVQSFYTNKKYIYWDSDNATVLQASNTMPTRSTKTHLVIINDNGIATTVPSTYDNFEISYDGGSDEVIKSRIYALYQKDKELGDKYIAIEQDVNGIKQFIGTSVEDLGTLVDKVSKIEQTSDEIQLSVSNIQKTYEDDKELSELRENLNSAIITLNSDIGTFNSEIQNYYKDDKISNEEKISIETIIDEVSSSKSEVLKHVNTVISITTEAGDTTNLIALNSAVEALNIAHTNLIQNIEVAISDYVITPSEKTVIIDAFSKYSLRLTELKNLCDDLIFLGVGGVLVDELSKISVKTDEIKLSISSVESNFKSDLSIQKIELRNQINDISNSLNTFKDTVNTTFRDGVISEAEKSLLQEKIANIDKEKLDIDTRYNSIVADTNLSTNVKSDLVKKYEVFNQKHTELKSRIEYVISDDMVNDAEKLNINALFDEYSSTLASLSVLITEAMENISFNSSQKEIEKAKNVLRSEINDVKSSIEGIDEVLDGTFENNILDEVERKNIRQNLDSFSREKLDIDKTYSELYNNAYLTGQDKVNLKNKYDDYISKYNNAVNISEGILAKEELVNNVDKANINNAIIKHNEAISVFHTYANKSIDIIATNKVNSAKNEVTSNLNNLRNEVDGLNEYVDNTFKNNIIDEAERSSISQNIETLNREKADIDKTYEVIYSNTYLDGQLKTNLKNSYNTFVSKHSETLNVIQAILDKDTLIDDNDRENMSNSFSRLNEALSNLISNINKSSEYITLKSVEAAKSELQSQIKNTNDKIDNIIADVEGVISDGIIEEAETMVIAENINRLNKEKLELDTKYDVIYNNSDLDGNIKTQLANAKSDFNNKFSNVITVINTIVEDNEITDEEKETFQSSINAYNTSFANLVKQLDLCVDYIANKKVDNASSLLTKELQELQGALDGLEDTMNTTFKDGILSEAEKNSISQNLKTLETSKLNIDKQYNVVYNNASLTGTAKTELKTSYDNYVSKYNSLVTVINNILNKEGLLVEADSTNLNNAFKNHNSAMSTYNEKVNKAIDAIAVKKVNDAKVELSNNISELNSALNGLENNMNNAFKDGVLSEAEKTSIKQHLLSVSSEKSDIDKRYATLYSNTNLVGTPKTNLTTAYNNYVSAYNSLVTVINNILEKEGLIDSTDQTNLDNAFKEHDSKLGLYSTADLNAIDAIAKKKVEDSEEKTNKKIAEIVVTSDSITQRVESVEKTTTTLTTNINTVTNTANNSVKSVEVLYYLSTSQTSLAGGSWSATAPTWVNGKYMWSKTKTTLSNGTVKESNPTCIAGAKGDTGATGQKGDKGDKGATGATGQKGDTGATGATGQGVSSITPEYYLSTSKTTQSGGSWVTTPPTWVNGKYMWIRNKIVYKNPASTVYTTPICDNSWEAVNDIKIGGRNLIRKSNIIKNSNQATYDNNTNTWTIVANAGAGGTWGSGLCLTGTNVVIPYGKTYTLSFEIKVPRSCSWNIDVNNYPVSGSAWSGNDNDNTSIRKTSSKSLASGQWIKCWSQFANTNTNNTGKVDIYDASNFGVVMQDETSNMTYYIRNIQGEIGNVVSEWSPAPEDVQAQIDSNTTKITTTSNKVATIETNVGSITSKVTNLETTTTTLNGKVTGIDTRLKTAEQKITDEAITSMVSDTFATKESVSKIEQKANSIELSVSKKVDSSSIISSINMSSETIKINSSKINISGYVTFTNLSTSGATTINGSNITTGTINASKVTVTNLNASNITSGYISANRLSGGTIDASSITVKNLSASNITSGTLSASRIDTTNLRVKGELISGQINGVGGIKFADGALISSYDSHVVGYKGIEISAPSVKLGSMVDIMRPTLRGNVEGIANASSSTVTWSMSGSGALKCSTINTTGTLTCSNITNNDLLITNRLKNSANNFYVSSSGAVGCTSIDNTGTLLQKGIGHFYAGVQGWSGSSNTWTITSSGYAYFNGISYFYNTDNINNPINSQDVSDIIDSVEVVDTSEGYRLIKNPKTKNIKNNRCVTLDDNDNVNIDLAETVSILWKAVQELRQENDELKKTYRNYR